MGDWLLACVNIIASVKCFYELAAIFKLMSDAPMNPESQLSSSVSFGSEISEVSLPWSSTSRSDVNISYAMHNVLSVRTVACRGRCVLLYE